MGRNWLLVCALGMLVVGEAARAAGKHGIYRTLDRGRSWVRSDQGIDAKFRINGFAELRGRVFAGTDGGVYVSMDEGRTWTLAAGTSVGRVLSMAVVGDKVFAGTDKIGLIASGDGGLSWTRVRSLTGNYVRSLLASGGTLFAGMDVDGVLGSADGGASWVAMKKGLPLGGQIFAMAESKGRLYAGLYARGLYGWSEGEWEKVGEVVPLELAALGEMLIAGHNPGGIHWSGDGGKRWAQATAVKSSDFGGLTAGAPVWKLGAGSGLAMAGAADGVFVSEDGGRTWARARTGLPTGAPGISFHIGAKYSLAGFVLP
jgi:hypothetical protein